MAVFNGNGFKWHFSDAGKYSWQGIGVDVTGPRKKKRNKLRKSLDKAKVSINRLKEINTEGRTFCSELSEILLGEKL